MIRVKSIVEGHITHFIERRFTDKWVKNERNTQ